MTRIEEAIAEIDSLGPGEDFCYSAIAKKYGVVRSTLARRHQGITQSRGAHASTRQNLNLQRERELVRYIESLTKRRIPPTREMIQNFASELAHKRVSDSWVTRFINHYNIHLISQWTTGMDRNRHQADSGDKYSVYFNLLQHKIN